MTATTSPEGSTIEWTKGGNRQIQKRKHVVVFETIIATHNAPYSHVFDSRTQNSKVRVLTTERVPTLNMLNCFQLNTRFLTSD